MLVAYAHSAFSILYELLLPFLILFFFFFSCCFSVAVVVASCFSIFNALQNSWSFVNPARDYCRFNRFNCITFIIRDQRLRKMFCDTTKKNDKTLSLERRREFSADELVSLFEWFTTVCLLQKWLDSVFFFVLCARLLRFLRVQLVFLPLSLSISLCNIFHSSIVPQCTFIRHRYCYWPCGFVRSTAIPLKLCC